MKTGEYYRATSWWLTWDDMIWPDDDIADKFKRHADKALESGVNMAVIYGAHFRWDYMPLWMNLHDMIRFIAKELHQRGILLFDHHSSVLTHRYSNHREALAMRLRNRHHLPFAPSRDIASEWTYEGMKLNDWRMIDLVTGKPVFLERYTAEQFCINNLNFRQAYQKYVRRLLDETDIDGLMSDDGIFYSGWTSCGCKWCREKFMKNYGHQLPDISDTNFWGNYKSDTFKDWIEMRFISAGEFLEVVSSVVGKKFPLMTCCSDSSGFNLPAVGMTYQDFIKSCNHVMLEMCGNTPSLDGTWQHGFPSQMLQLGIARENKAPCIGLGYGFTESTADFIWAFNKFLGSSTWFSSLKGRLGLRDSQMFSLKDDTELPGNGFNWEKDNPEIFNAEVDTNIAVFFSRWSRDFYSMTSMDYVNDYQETCFELLNTNITFNVVVAPPKVSEYKVLCLSSVSCLDIEEYSALNSYLRDGGIIVASGPCGCYDKRGKKLDTPWLKQFDVLCEIKEPERVAVFPPSFKQKEIVPSCSGIYQELPIKPTEWIEIKIEKGKLFWTPGRMQENSKEILLAERLHNLMLRKIIFKDENGWRFRIFKNKGKSIIHGLAENFSVACMDNLEKLRKNHSGNNLINNITRNKTVLSKISLKLEKDFKSATFYAPLNGVQKTIEIKNRTINLNIDNNIYYFILQLE